MLLNSTQSYINYPKTSKHIPESRKAHIAEIIKAGEHALEIISNSQNNIDFEIVYWELLTQGKPHILLRHVDHQENNSPPIISCFQTVNLINKLDMITMDMKTNATLFLGKLEIYTHKFQLLIKYASRKQIGTVT